MVLRGMRPCHPTVSVTDAADRIGFTQATQEGQAQMIEAAVVTTTLLVGLVAGFLFGFAVIAMPGLGTLRDGEFLRAFQVMDRVIQENHPLFMLVWVGSVVATVATVIIGLSQLSGGDLVLLIAAAALYLAGVQVPTATINIPLNNRVQLVDTADADQGTLTDERAVFEPRWNRWNRIRTAAAVVATLLFLILLVQL